MSIRIADKDRITKDGRKYFYAFQYNKKRYTSSMYKTEKEAEIAEKHHKLILIKEEKQKEIKKQEKLDKEKSITFKELYDEMYNYKFDKVKETTLYSYKMTIGAFFLYEPLLAGWALLLY